MLATELGTFRHDHRSLDTEGYRHSTATDENAALVLLRGFEARVAGIGGRTTYESGSGRELSAVWSGESFTVMTGRSADNEHETHVIP
ncbi:MAG: hypothetical protein ACYDEV_05370 [Acidiferrobacter sp.]